MAHIALPLSQGGGAFLRTFAIVMATEIITIISTLLVSFGGWEAIKWLMNRKSNQRIASADAENKELHNDIDEFRYLRERLEVAEQHLVDKENRFNEQTEIVRELNRKVLELTIENGKKEAEIAKLLAERAMKLCNIRCCPNREPQSGY